MIEAASHWAFQTAAMLLTAGLIPRLRITSIFGAFGIVAALSLVNSTIWDASLFFGLPQHLSFHVVLLLGVNGLIFWILVKLLPGIEVDGILPAIAAPIVFSLLSILVYAYAREIDWEAVFREFVQFMEGVKSFFKNPPVTQGKG